MWRRLNREDLVEGVSPFLETRGDVEFRWYIYEDYEPVERGPLSYIRAADPSKVRSNYKPLQESPHLFLAFARLAEQKNLAEAVIEWISKKWATRTTQAGAAQIQRDGTRSRRNELSQLSPRMVG